jgi:eukaryotic-like serine/threonine-protein kinase
LHAHGFPNNSVMTSPNTAAAVGDVTTPANEHARLKALFTAVCDLPLAHHAAELARLHATANEIAAVNTLLEKDARSTDSGDSPISPTMTTTGADTPPRRASPIAALIANVVVGQSANSSRIDTAVGSWKIVEKIGEGGMGAVYRAKRNDGQFEQTVAIKFLSGWATKSAVARLIEERKTLAALEHPNIARLIDGGTTADGIPFIAMDFVDGVAIDQYCKRQQSNTREILKMMVDVCAAVSYAHQSLRLHCDLKPPNIMVDSAGRPKLLDFGIAELMDGEVNAAGGVRAAAYTPGYASPEQRAGNKLSTATDVYSLGRVMAELIDGAPKSHIALRREAMAIASMACADKIAARYASVGAMRADLERALAHLPVLAVGGGVVYKSQKLIERRWGVSIALTALIAATVVFTHNLIRERDRALRAEASAATELERALVAEDVARAERDRAQVSELRASDRERDAAEARQAALIDRDLARRAEQVSKAEVLRALRAEAKAEIEADNTRVARDFLYSLFDDTDPNRGGSAQLSTADLLKRGLGRANSLPAEQNELKTSMLRVLGRIHENVGLFNEARAIFQSLATIESDPKTGRRDLYADALGRIAVIDHNSQHSARGEQPARESLAIRLELFGPGSLPVADAENTLGIVLTGLNRSAEAGERLSSALAIRERLSGPRNEDVASTLHNLGLHYAQVGKLDEAERAYRRSLDIKYQLLGKTHFKTLNSLQRLAIVLTRQRRFAEAEPILAEAYQSFRVVQGENSEILAQAANEWASTLHDMGRYTDAERLYREAINNPARRADATGRRPLSYAVSVNNLATLFEEIGELTQAEQNYRIALAVRMSHLAPDDLSVARGQSNLGRALIKLGKTAEARTLLSRSLATRTTRLGAKHGDVYDTIIGLAECDLFDGQRPSARETLGKLDAAIVSQRPLRVLAKRRLDAQLADEPEQLGIWQERVSFATKQLGETHLATLRSKLDSAEALMATTRQAEQTAARALAAEIAPAMLAVLAEPAPERQRLQRILATEAASGAGATR